MRALSALSGTECCSPHLGVVLTGIKRMDSCQAVESTALQLNSKLPLSQATDIVEVAVLIFPSGHISSSSVLVHLLGGSERQGSIFGDSFQQPTHLHTHPRISRVSGSM
jgi:hypothetical protein